jgi:hypothetical protein
MKISVVCEPIDVEVFPEQDGHSVNPAAAGQEFAFRGWDGGEVSVLEELPFCNKPA